MYIVTSPKHKVMTPDKRTISEPKRVLCYAKNIGKHRHYRQHIDNIDKGLYILKFKELSLALKALRKVESIENNIWDIEEVDE